MKISMFSKTRAYAKHFVLVTLTLIITLGFVFVLSPSVLADNDGIGGTRFTTDYGSQEEVYEAANLFNEKMVEEGIVLVKNEGNTLPLAKGSKINVLGKNSAKIAIGGTGSSTGSGSVEAKQGLSLYESLEEAGFILNPALKDFYEDDGLSGPGRPSVAMGANLTSLSTGETPPENYDAALLATYADYDDAAIVVLTRIGGEGYDLPTTQVNAQGQTVAGSEEGDHYLQLDLYEKAIFESLEDDPSVTKVIVIVNAVQQMELGFLNDEINYSKVKAAIVVGGPGQTGTAAIGRILNGDVNPSGRLPATYAADFKTDPVWYNFARSGNKGTYIRVNAVDGEGNKTTASTSTNFVDYEEGIYLGYRYWETRGFDQNDNWQWYDDHIVYPFGYGLSYTEFTWELVDSDIPVLFDVDSEFSFDVKVKNVGARAGKDVVQLYYTAPYYDGGIEKSFVRLADFAKTPILEPGEDAIVTLTVTGKELAAYDFSDANKNGHKGYELEAGDYIFRFLESANARHTKGILDVTVNVPQIDDDTAVNGKTGVIYTHDENTGNPIMNLFDDVSQRALNGELDPIERDSKEVRDSGGFMNVMSRASAKGGLSGTIPTAYPTDDRRYVSPEFIATFGVPANPAARNLADEGQPWYQEEFPTQAENDQGEVTIFLKDLIGKDFNDPLWDDFLDQLTYKEMATLIGDGGFHTRPMPRVGKPWSIEVDGPVGLVPRQVYGPLNGEIDDLNNYFATVYATEPVVAATFNKELVYEYGKMTGEEGIWGNTDYAYSGIYAPGINIHRSPFSGRNFEYYSEDGVLSAKIAAEFSRGAYEKGLYVMMKHYVLNDQETNRGGIHTWADEQTMREIYFLPYEKAIKDGNAMGAMAAYNHIGTVWTGASYPLMTALTRTEWGFEGMIITDWGGYSTNTEWMIRTGVDLLLAGGTPGVLLHEGEALTPTQAHALRRATKAIMFTVSNSNAMIPRLSYSDANTKPTNFLRGVPYTVDVTGAGPNYFLGQELDVTYSAVGLPSQLTLDAETGLITGTLPLASGNWWQTDPPTSYTFTVTATVPQGQTINTKVRQTFVIDQASLATKPLLDSAYVGVPYYSDSLQVDPSLPVDRSNISFRLDPGAGFPPFFVTRPASGPLPNGLVVNNDGTITGTPSAGSEGSYDVIIQVRAPGFADQFIRKTINVLPAVLINDALLPPAEVGKAYVEEIIASGIDNIVFSAVNLPEGLTLSNDGTLYGVPEEAGSFMFTITASGEGVLPADATFMIVVEEEEVIVVELPTLTFDDVLLVSGKVDKAYNATLAAAGSDNITYTAVNLPTGLSLSAAGVISGTPEVAGVYLINVTASAIDAESATAAVVIYVEPEIEELKVIRFDDVIVLGAGQVGKAYEAVLKANGADGITFAGLNLPAGLSIAANGTISGTPTAAGTFMFTVTASADGAVTSAASVILAIEAAPEVPEPEAPVIGFDDVIVLGEGQVGKAFSATLLASGAEGITFVGTGLPAGLSINASGKISGTPTAAGSFMFTVTASANGAVSSVASVVVVIKPAPEVIVPEVVVPEINFDDVIVLAAGLVDKAYNAKLTASGAEGITFEATGLPAGLSLNADGTISGTPTAAGSYMFKVTASADGALASVANVIIVVAEVPAETPVATGCGSALGISTIAMAILTLGLAGAFVVLRKRD